MVDTWGHIHFLANSFYSLTKGEWEIEIEEIQVSGEKNNLLVRFYKIANNELAAFKPKMKAISLLHFLNRAEPYKLTIK